MRRLILIAALILFIGEQAFGQRFNQSRDLAPGVLKTVPLELSASDTNTIRIPLPDLNAADYAPNTFNKAKTLFGSTREIVLYRDVWAYEFSHIGLRQGEFDVPRPDGTVARTNVWYLIYRVRNVGKTISYETVVDEVVKIDEQRIVYDGEAIDQTTMYGRFLPVFELVSWVQNPETREYDRREQADELFPTVTTQIQLEEDANRDLLDSVQMSRIQLPLAQGEHADGVWGVAIWTGVDPRADYISVRIKGLTNAYRIVNHFDGDKSFQTRELQLNFYRPGDTVNQDKDRIFPGIQLVDSPKEQAVIARRYELPGPLFRIYEEVNGTELEMRLEADSQVDVDTFISPLAVTLNEGRLPESLAKGLADLGVSVPQDLGVETLVPGGKWSATIGDRVFIISMRPEFWERFGDGIRLIKRLDYAWIYR